MVQATGLIGTNKAFEIESFGLALEMGMKFFCAQVRATAPRIVFRTLIRAHENMSLERWHDCSLAWHRKGVEPLHQQRDVVAAQEGRLLLRCIQNGHDFIESQGGSSKFVNLRQFRALADM
jgi:hypothetical protein